MGPDGQVMKCHNCGSEEHLKRDCPRNARHVGVAQESRETPFRQYGAAASGVLYGNTTPLHRVGSFIPFEEPQRAVGPLDDLRPLAGIRPLDIGPLDYLGSNYNNSGVDANVQRISHITAIDEIGDTAGSASSAASGQEPRNARCSSR